jgi:hypothetical protein
MVEEKTSILERVEKKLNISGHCGEEDFNSRKGGRQDFSSGRGGEGVSTSIDRVEEETCRS